MLWEVDIYAAPGQPDRLAARVQQEAAALGLGNGLSVVAARGFLIEGELSATAVEKLARELLSDDVVERSVVAPAGDARLAQAPAGAQQVVHVLPKPGVMDPVAQSTVAAIADFGLSATQVRTLYKYWLGALAAPQLNMLCGKVLANDAIEQVVLGPLAIQRLEVGGSYTFRPLTVALCNADDDGLLRISREGQLSLSLAEMRTIQDHARQLGRDLTDAELETLAQTWSEHCSHKTLKGRIRYRGPDGAREFGNLLKETIFAATQELRRRAGADDWCVSVFEDNAGIVRFDDETNVVFKVETHNHPSAIEPYGGANTGLGGVIRDPLGTGLGAKPILNTNVFCFAPPHTPAESLPAGVLHPARVLRGVVSGVRDYGNRMGIPTVNGALYFDARYLGNPLVYCGNVGLLPRDKSTKRPREGDYIVALGGRTGRDGIHGATFSSVELTSESETLSGGAVQIGNAITEKMVLDVVLAARDRGLYTAITDCGAGGFSSAVGEMGAEIGAEVQLDRVPLKYSGLSYTEIWISEAQERMVLSVPPDRWEALSALATAEGVEATVIGRFVPTRRLTLHYQGHQVADLSMDFLHDGRPEIVHEAVYALPPTPALRVPSCERGDRTAELLAILGSLNVASKEWVIRQYDHEVQGGSVVKPLVGATEDGPGDAAVVRPRLGSRRGLVVACGMNPRYGDLDPYAMAAAAIDEAVRNCVAVGADPARIAILDNFCWGNTQRPETLGALVRAAVACRDVALALETPFISGKDSLYNEFSYVDEAGQRQTVAIPYSLLISALGQIADVTKAITSDLKQAGHWLYLIGDTRDELGGSHWALVTGQQGGQVPSLDGPVARRTFVQLHAAIDARLVRACHDLSEGGLAVAAAEMAFAGQRGVEIDLTAVPVVGGRSAGLAASPDGDVVLRLFSESNSRFLCEVAPPDAAKFEQRLAGVPYARIGQVVAAQHLRIMAPAADGQPGASRQVINAPLAALRHAWQAPLRL